MFQVLPVDPQLEVTLEFSPVISGLTQKRSGMFYLMGPTKYMT